MEPRGWVIETLERRLLLSGQPPTANDDAFSVLENQTLDVTPGVSSLYFNGNNSLYNGTHTWTNLDGSFSASAPFAGPVPNSIRIAFQGNISSSDIWIMNFGAPGGQSLVPGTYLNAKSYPNNPDGAAPEIDFWSDPYTEEPVTGQFTVVQANFDEITGRVESFAATFKIILQGSPGELDGRLNYCYMTPGFQSGILNNDVGSPGKTLSASLVSPTTNGAVHLNPDGSFTYTPNPNFNGVDQFTYFTSDGILTSNVANVSIQVTYVNQQPTYNYDYYVTANQDGGAQTIVNWATDISPGPANEAGQQVSFHVKVTSDPGLFSVLPSVDPAGTLTFSPAAGITGEANISVFLSDDGGTENGGTNKSWESGFQITVLPVDHAPVASDDELTTLIDTAFTLAAPQPQSSLLLNGDGFLIAGTHTFLPGYESWFSGNISYGGVIGGYTNDAADASEDWNFDFYPPEGQNLRPGMYQDAQYYLNRDLTKPMLVVSGDGRSADSITGQFTVHQLSYDLNGNLKSFSADFVQYANGSTTPLTGRFDFEYLAPSGLVANDTDPDGDVLTPKLVSQPTHGSATLNPDGSITYLPAAGFTGTDTFTYQASDGQLDSNVATVTVLVKPLPIPNTDAGGPYSVNEGSSVSLSGFNSTDPQAAIVSYEWDFDYNGSSFTTDATGPTPLFSAAGLDGPSSKTVALRATDANGLSTIATSTVKIWNVAPTALFSADNAKQEVSFTGATDASLADAAAGFTYSYDFNFDGKYEIVDSPSATVTVPREYLTWSPMFPGPLRVGGRIKDKDGAYTGYVAVFVTGSIFGTVFDDANGNGKHDPNEGGVRNVTVYIDLNNNGQMDIDELWAGATTDASGAYQLGGLPPGDYVVRESVPSGRKQISPANNRGVDVTVVGSQLRTRIDFISQIIAGPISGKVFNDLDGNGRPNSGEPGLSGIVVYNDANNDGKLSNGELSQITDASGNYVFNNLLPGSYKIREVLPSGRKQTVPASNFGWTITLSSSQPIQTGKNFAEVGTVIPPPTPGGSIRGNVFNDLNGNGILNSGETGLSGIVVYDDLNNDGKLDNGELSAITDANGNYQLTSLSAGNHKIREIVPAGWKQTTPSSNYGWTITLAANQSLTGKNFGEQVATAPPPPTGGSISGTVFNDANGDLKQDNGELGLAGWTVYIDTNNDGILDNGEAHMLTNANGSYTFSNLAAGNYLIRAIRLSGWSQTTPAKNYGQHVTIAKNQNVTSIIFGERKIA